jgi:hypothetical protein
MSSLPGLLLEDFVAWQHDVVVEGNSDPNFSLGLAEALGKIPQRACHMQEYFKSILVFYEPWRERIEDKLDEFDEDNQSWRAYAPYVADTVPNSLLDLAHKLLRTPQEVTIEMVQAAWASTDEELTEVARDLDFTHSLYKEREKAGKAELAKYRPIEASLRAPRRKAQTLGQLRFFLCRLTRNLSQGQPA